MLDESLISTIKGRKTGAPTALRRLFGVVFKGIGQRRQLRHRRRHRPRGSNAEYHLTIKQVRRIIEAGQTLRDRVLIQSMAETGMRRSEVAGLQVEDVRWADRVVVVRQGKGNKLRLVPITRTLAENMTRLVTGRCSGPAFVSRSGGRLSVRQVNRIVAAAGRQAGVTSPNPKQKHVSCHLFRHSFARQWKEQGGSIETLSRILGHSSVKTTWDLYGTESMHDVRRNYGRVMQKLSR